LPFSGRANFVHGLDVFVGLPKDVDALGHLCFCRWLGDDKHVWFSKENLSSEDPEAESHVGTTYTSLLGRKQVLPCGVRQQWGCQSCAEVAGGVGRLPPKLTLSFDDILSQLWHEWRPDSCQDCGAMLRGACGSILQCESCGILALKCYNHVVVLMRSNV
jgi:hypothetical protein